MIEEEGESQIDQLATHDYHIIKLHINDLKEYIMSKSTIKTYTQFLNKNYMFEYVYSVDVGYGPSRIKYTKIYEKYIQRISANIKMFSIKIKNIKKCIEELYIIWEKIERGVRYKYIIDRRENFYLSAVLPKALLDKNREKLNNNFINKCKFYFKRKVEELDIKLLKFNKFFNDHIKDIIRRSKKFSIIKESVINTNVIQELINNLNINKDLF